MDGVHSDLRCDQFHTVELDIRAPQNHYANKKRRPTRCSRGGRTKPRGKTLTVVLVNWSYFRIAANLRRHGAGRLARKAAVILQYPTPIVVYSIGSQIGVKQQAQTIRGFSP